MINRIASLILSVYIAAFIYTNAFFIKTLTIGEGTRELFWNHLAIFVILLLPIHLLVNKYVSMPYTRGPMRHVRGVLLSLAFVGLVLTVLYRIVPLEPVYNLPVYIDQIFASDLAYTIWLILPLLILLI